MNAKLRQSMAAKMTAIGFIAIVLASNFWLIQLLFKEKPHPIIVFLFYSGVCTALIGGVWMFMIFLWDYYNKGK